MSDILAFLRDVDPALWWYIGSIFCALVAFFVYEATTAPTYTPPSRVDRAARDGGARNPALPDGKGKPSASAGPHVGSPPVADRGRPGTS